MSDKTLRRGIAMLFIAGLLLRAVWVVAVPLWQQADEYPHFYYIQYLYTHNTLPVSKPDFPYYQGYQPPLYYYLASGIYGLFPDLDYQRHIMGESSEIDWRSENFQSQNPMATLLRWFSVLLWIGTFWTGYFSLVRITPDHRGVIFTGLGLLALLPTYVSNSSSITNDCLIILLCSLFVWGLVALDLGKLWHLVLLGILLGVAILTKYNGLILIPALILFLRPFNREYPWKRLLVVLAPACVLVIPWLIYTSSVYGQAFPINPEVPKINALTMGNVLHAGRNLFWSFWAAAGRIYEIHLPVWCYVVVFGGVSLVTGFGLLRSFFRAKENRNTVNMEYDVIVWSVIILIILTVISIYGFSHAVRTAWGKNLYVWMLPLAYLSGMGWTNISSRNYWLVLFPLTLFLTDIVYLFVFVLPYFYD